MNTLTETNFQFPGQAGFYKGKVRDVYSIGRDLLVMIVSDRVSAFDVVLPRGIPYKGQVLNQIAYKSLNACKDIVQSWIIDTPDPVVAIGKKCEPYKVEMVIRGYLSGHAAREYKSGKRLICGVEMPDGMKENDRFPVPIITPTTKASEGHDLDISREEILKQGIISKTEYLALEDFTRRLYQRGSEIASGHGLILVDTKYEFGKGQDGEIYVIDEIHTPDSSRYFYAEGYEERQAEGAEQKQLSKEFLRQWLISNNFQGKDGQTIPEMNDEIVKSISDRYIELYENITGEPFIKADISNIEERIEKNILNWITKNS